MMGRQQPSMKQTLLLTTLALFTTTALAQGTSTTTDETSTTEATSSLPGLTTSSTKTTANGTSSDLSLPSLSTGSGTYSYPAPSVPPTANAPFMQTSDLPEGTVFIAVGAILGAFGAAVLIWRAIVVCLLHRSVKRAAMAQHLANDKAGFPGPGAGTAPFYKYHDDSNPSIGAVNAAAGRGVRRTTRGPVPSSTPSQSNLFFSPTAPSGPNSAGNRSSTLLPSGFYAAGQGVPQQHQTSHSISLTNLRPDSRGLGRPLAQGHTPPESPGLMPRSDHGRRNMSTSSLSLNRPPSQGQRAPSTYLEDLLHENPTQFPPSQVRHSQTWNNTPPRGHF